MRKQRNMGWWGLYALFPLLIGLMVLDETIPVSETWHNILLIGIIFLISYLALAWVERNPRLVERSGIDSPVTYRIVRGEAFRPDTSRKSNEEARR